MTTKDMPSLNNGHFALKSSRIKGFRAFIFFHGGVCEYVSRVVLVHSDAKQNIKCLLSEKRNLERMKELCKEHNSLYEKQNDLNGQKQKIVESLER